MTHIQKELFKMQDLEYRDFTAKLIPTVNPDTIIGVRTPRLRAFAKSLRDGAQDFLNALPHQYYEENNLHAFIIAETKDFDLCIDMLERFLPHIDNWATCDSLRPKCFKNNKDKLVLHIKRWIKSDHTYTVRFAIEMLMTFYLDDDFDDIYHQMVSEVKSEEYYVNMMISWYFATALALRWESTVLYIEQNRLPLWVHNKTIQKAIESYRITDGQKEYLRTLKRS